MPRTSAVECPGCPPLRALTTDTLGLIKVVEARGKAEIPKVVETWGVPDASRCVLATSFAEHKKNPLLAVARKNGSVEFLNPLNGNAIAGTKIGESNSSSHAVEDDLIVGIHLLRAESIELSSKLIMPLICTEKGKACVQSITTTPYSTETESRSTWDVCGSGKLTCSSVDASKNFALFGGKGVEVNLWDIHNCKKTWTAKSPRSNSLGIFSPTWFTSSTFLSKDDHRRIATGTSNHQVRLYDISAQRRPVISVSFRESPVKVVTADQDGNTIYIGTGTGDLASFDMRTGKLLGCFVGKCSGSIRSIVRHPELPLIASCGLDRYLRFWNTKTRQLLSAVFLKQHLTNVVIDSHFSTEEIEDHYADEASTLQVTDHSEVEDDDEYLSSKRKLKTKRNKNQDQDQDQDDDRTSEAPSAEVEEEEQGKKKQKKKKKNKEGKKLPFNGI